MARQAVGTSGFDFSNVMEVVTGAGTGICEGIAEAFLNRPGPINDDERNKLRERYRWEVIGPNPL